MSMKLSFALLVTSLSFSSFSAEYIAKVTKLRGIATQLIPGKLEATKLKIGDQLTEDTSVVTNKKSFVRIQLFDGSNISLGPSGKVVVSKMNRKGRGILTLLKGQIRSKVNGQKYKGKSHKFLVKTRSAALGVRGTEFQTIYNPENNITNLLTYSGEVAIAKVDDGSSSESYEKQIDKISRKQVSKSQSHKLKNDLNNKMESALKGSDVVVVKRGQFSGTIDSIKKASLPVNISESQLNTLYSNVDLNVATKAKKADLSKASTKKNFLKPIASKVPAEGVYNPATGDFAQKSGGFIDIETGIYIPPEKSALFSQTHNTYLAQKVGSFDVNTGEYIAPKGLVLDSSKGFVAKSSPKKNQAAIMNSIIDKKIVLKKKKLIKKERYYNQLELFAKNSISVRVASVSQTIKHYDSPQVNTRDIKSTGTGVVLKWDHSSGGKWQPITNISYRKVSFDQNELGQFNQGTSSLYGMELGIRRYINSRINLSTSFGLNQSFFTASSTDSSSVTTYDLRKATVPVLDVSGQWFYAKSKRYDLDLNLGVTFSLNKSAKDVDFGSGVGAKLGAGFRYWFKRNWWGRLDYRATSSKHDISGTNYTAVNEIINSTLGVEVGYVL